MGHRQDEPRNAAGLIFKMRIIVAVQDLKINFYVQILVPPYFWLVLPYFVCSGDGTDCIASNKTKQDTSLLSFV